MMKGLFAVSLLLFCLFAVGSDGLFRPPSKISIVVPFQNAGPQHGF